MAQHRRTLSMRVYMTLLTVLALLCTLLPVVPPNANAAAEPIELSKKVLPVGYAATQLTVTANTSFPLVKDTKVTAYDLTGKLMPVIENVVVHDSKRLTFQLTPGLKEGTYSLMVQSTYVSIVEFSITTQYDPTNVIITPGADHDIRIDWKDPLGIDIKAILIQYVQMDTGQRFETVVAPGVETVTLKDNLIRGKSYTIKMITERLNSSRSTGLEFTNGGQGYRAIDTTPPGQIKNISITAVENGFAIRWTDPTDADLATIAVQYAEHGTTAWSDSSVVAKGVQQVIIREMNIARRYDFRFTKTDKYSNWAYQLEDKDGFGYNFDTMPPTEVTSLVASGSSDSSATLSWVDPMSTDVRNNDYHHANIYIRGLYATEDDWKPVGRVDKGIQSYLINGLHPNIQYLVKVTTVDSFGNESVGSTRQLSLQSVDLSYVANPSILKIVQEVEGGLEFKWGSDTLSAVEFGKFKIMYTTRGSNEWKETKFSNIKVKSASLRDLPRGTYIFKFRLGDRYGVEQDLGAPFLNNNQGYYVSGYTDVPTEVGDVRIQPSNGRDMLITWTAATTNGTHVEVYYAERSTTPNWVFHGRVDKRDQRYTISNLDKTKDYFFKLVVFDTNKDTKSLGVVYNNSGYGYNLLGGDRHAPGEVTNATATITLNTLAVTYVEPTDPDFDSAIIYVYKLNNPEVFARVNVSRGSNGTVLRDLLPGFAYTLKITTIDTFGNESAGVTLDNNKQGYLLTGTAISRVEVRNPLLIPDANRLIVRFRDPMAPEYHHAIVSIRKVGETNYTRHQTVNRASNVAPNEVVFTNLESNQQYQVRIIAVMNNGKETAGLSLGGEKGFNLLRVNNVSNAFVTPGANRLSLGWQNHPTSTLPTAIQVEYQKIGTNVWSEPLILGPYTNEAVIAGLPHDNSAYRVRITHVLNHVASTGVILDNGGSGFMPRDSYMVATPAVVHQNSYEWQDLKLIGTNTRFSWSTSSTSPSTIKLYGPDGQEVTGGLADISVVNTGQLNLKVRRNLQTGTYTIVLKSREDGELSTTFDIQSSLPAPTLVASSVHSITYKYGQLAMTVTGSNFTPTTTATIDNGTKVPVTFIDDHTLRVNPPTGLLPGVHKLTVHNDNVSSKPLAFTVHPFANSLALTTPTMRTGNYKAELTVNNLDSNARSGKVYLVIRRNGVQMEIKETSYQFSPYELKKFTFEFGGNNTPYADGPTNTITIQAYVVDGFHQTTVSEPVIYTRELNL